MKRIILILLLCVVGGSLSLSAQQPGNNRRGDFEKFKSERKVYISKEMNLTKEEAAAFWPLNDELQSKKFELNGELREQMHAIRQARREGKQRSDADYRKIIEAGAKVKVKEAELEERYLKKFLEVIPAEKMFRYQSAENEFARKMMDNRDGRPRPQR